MRKGLVVGKFCPLTRGHQFLIETALAETDELTIVIYDVPGFEDEFPMAKRADWLAHLYPQATAIIPHRDPLYDDYSDHSQHDTGTFSQLYANDLKQYGIEWTHVFSSEEYGEPFAYHLGAQHVTVDAARELLPVSGTMVREDLYKHRGWIDPYVYRSLIKKICFVGTESTGKTTLAATLAKKYDTRWVAEYGRELWEELEGGTFPDLLTVGVRQYEREQAASNHANKYLFCDTNVLTTLWWSELYNKTADPRLKKLADDTQNEYTYFLCMPDFDWVDDGLRELAGPKQMEFHRHIKNDLADRHIKPVELRYDLENRIDTVEEYLDPTWIPIPRT